MSYPSLVEAVAAVAVAQTRMYHHSPHPRWIVDPNSSLRSRHEHAVEVVVGDTAKAAAAAVIRLSNTNKFNNLSWSRSAPYLVVNTRAWAASYVLASLDT